MPEVCVWLVGAAQGALTEQQQAGANKNWVIRSLTQRVLRLFRHNSAAAFSFKALSQPVSFSAYALASGQLYASVGFTTEPSTRTGARSRSDARLRLY